MSKGMVARGPEGAVTPQAPIGAVGQAGVPDVATPEPGSIKSERPGPAPAKKTEQYLAKAQPDAIDLNERKWSAKKAALHADAVKAGEEFKVDRGQPLFGSRLEPVEGEQPAEGAEAETPAEGEQAAAEPSAEEKQAQELREIAKRDRENRKLRKELRQISASRASEAKKMEQLKELAKKSPRAFNAYFGITDQAVLQDIRDNGDKPAEVPKFEEAPPEKDDSELQAERKKRQELERQIAVRDTVAVTQRMVNEDGASRWAAVKAMGEEAVQEAVDEALIMVRGAKRTPTQKEARGILEYWLDHVNKKYASIGARVAGAQPKQPAAKEKPKPRNPVTVPRQNPMEQRNPFHDPNDPRNRPTWRELGERSRRKVFGS